MRIQYIVLVIILACTPLLIQVQGETEAKRRERVENWDLQNLRTTPGFRTIITEDMLQIPKGYPGPQDFTIAATPPTIDFALIHGIHPEFFPQPVTTWPDQRKGTWSNWAEVTKSPAGKFYMATGDHRVQNAQVFITEYDPADRAQRVVVDVDKACGWKRNQYVHGKIHGRMDILPDGTLVAATWQGNPIKQEWIDHGYIRGGYVLTYNTNTGRVNSHGIPFHGDSWPCYAVDQQAGTLLAVGNYFQFMSYEVPTRTLRYGGHPPDSITWGRRAMLLDQVTGKVYSTDEGTAGYRFVSFNPSTNAFRQLDCAVPKNPVTGKRSRLRAYTAHRTLGDLFYCMDQEGTLFKFSPDREAVEIIDVNWGKSGVYTVSMALSPGERYLYYLPGANGQFTEQGTPVVQYDLHTGTKKVLAFLGPYIHRNYGYITEGTYGIELSRDGSLLVVQMNGLFGPDWRKRGRYEHPSIFAIHIPESEREE